MDSSFIKSLMDEIADLKQKFANLSLRRITQDQLIPSVVKARHIGAGVPFIQSGVEADLPTAGSAAAEQGSPIYFATDTKKLYIDTGSAWVSVTLA